ncbi:hypothetical protein [Salinisphaera aquimarina]|uniref:Uncharacterized protein n=1 Tax=Salinisphaera aquimarina TaxID=2094031 RepID=A0ABV7ETY5_9GAMM
MDNSNETIAAVRDAYRLIHGYQSALLQILEEAKSQFDATSYWEWNPTGGRQPTQRKCPLINTDAANFLPLLNPTFYYTTRNHDEAVEPGDVVLCLFHSGDTEFAGQEDGSLYQLEPNDAIEPASGTATSELVASVVVNMSGSTWTWREIEQEWSTADQWSPGFKVGETPAGFKTGDRANEWLLEKPEKLDKRHELQIVGAAARMEDLCTTLQIKDFLSRLHDRVDAVKK